MFLIKSKTGKTFHRQLRKYYSREIRSFYKTRNKEEAELYKSKEIGANKLIRIFKINQCNDFLNHIGPRSLSPFWERVNRLRYGKRSQCIEMLIIDDKKSDRRLRNSLTICTKFKMKK